MRIQSGMNRQSQNRAARKCKGSRLYPANDFLIHLQDNYPVSYKTIILKGLLKYRHRLDHFPFENILYRVISNSFHRHSF